MVRICLNLNMLERREYTVQNAKGYCKDILKYVRMYENIRYNMQTAIVRICLKMLECTRILGSGYA